MAPRLEHANLCVSNIESMVTFLQTAFPEFRVRGEGISASTGRRWLHVGTDDTYIALQESSMDVNHPRQPYTGVPGVNHLAYEVDDASEIRTRMTNAGYKESTPPNAHPHRTRVYFFDPEGNDWEFVQYHTDDRAKRNDYELPDGRTS